MAARQFPKRWYVNIRLHLADTERARDGWRQAAFRFRSRAEAQKRFDQVARGDLGIIAASYWPLHRYNERPAVRAVITWGSSGANGKVYGETEVVA